MTTTDEVYNKLYDLWWDVLEKNKDIERFQDEFFIIAFDEGFEREDIEQFWNFGG